MEKEQEKKYVKPTLDIVTFEIEDIICSSPVENVDPELIP